MAAFGLIAFCYRQSQSEGVCQDYSLVSVAGGTAEYTEVTRQFYRTMTHLTAVVTGIQRLHNPVLWQFYTMSVLLLLFCVILFYLWKNEADFWPLPRPLQM